MASLADDRGIGIVRGQILNFASTRTIYNGGYKATKAISQSIKQYCGGSGSIFLFGPDPDDFLEKAKMYTILTGTERRDCLKSYSVWIVFFPTQELLVEKLLSFPAVSSKYGTGYRYTVLISGGIPKI